jgi:hypothetical protein
MNAKLHGGNSQTNRITWSVQWERLIHIVNYINSFIH